MNAPLDISVVLRAEKGAPLTADEADGNIKNIVAAIRQVAAYGGGRGLALAEYDPDSGVVTLLDTGNAVIGTFALPPRPWRPKGTLLAGVAYSEGDLFRIEASASVPRAGVYYATKGFTAAADAADDISAGKVTVLAYDGKPAQTVQGEYNPSRTYAVGDVVTYNGIRWQLFEAAPGGSTPGAPVFANNTFTFPWGGLTVSQTRPLRLWAKGKPAAGAELAREMIERAGIFQVHFAGATASSFSKVSAGTAAQAVANFTVLKNGSVIGTIRFAANSKEATFVTVDQANFTFLAVGDVISIVAPAQQDGSLADVTGYLSIIQG